MCLLYWNDFNTWNVQETNTLYKKRIGYEILIIILICTEIRKYIFRRKNDTKIWRYCVISNILNKKQNNIKINCPFLFTY